MGFLRAKSARIALLWAGCVIAPAAHGTQYVDGDQATLQWSAASGDVLLYAVYVARNGAPFPAAPERYTVDTRTTLSGETGDRVAVQVAAVGISGEGPRSATSDTVVFGSVDADSMGGDPRFSTDLSLGGAGGADLLWYTASDNLLTLWQQNGVGGVQARSLSGWGSAGYALAGTGDFDGNGTLDLLWRDTLGTNLIQLRISYADDWTLGLTTWLQPAYEVAAVADVDGDGKSDIVWRDTRNGSHVIWRMSRFNRQSATVIGGPGAGWRIAASYDEDGDGRADLLWRDAASGLNQLWHMQGTDAWTATWMAHEPPRFHVVASGDLDGDGDGEILWEDAQSEERVLWMGTSGQRRTLQDPLGAGWLAAGAADLDGDGTRELLLQHRASNLLVSGAVRNAAVTETPFLGFAPTPLSLLRGR